MKHLAVADWIEKMAGARLVDDSELLAHHTTEAIALGQASGASRDPELELRSGAVPRPAGDRASRARCRSSRCTLHAGFLELLTQGSEEHGLTLLKLADTRSMAGRFEAARAHAEAAASELEAVGAARSAARAYSLLGNVYFQLGEPIACEQPSNARSSSSNRFRRGRSTSRRTGESSLEALSGRSPEAALEWAEKAIDSGSSSGCGANSSARISGGGSRGASSWTSRGSRTSSEGSPRQSSCAWCSRFRHT